LLGSLGVAIVLTTKTLLGAGWTVSARMAGRAVDFITVLILARALSPADFGLTAIAMSLISVVDVVLELPVILALTRLRSLSRSHLDTAFTLGALRGLFVSLVVVFAAWPFSHIYGDQRLIPLVVALSLGPIARSLFNPRMVEQMRQMNFRLNFLAEFLGKIISSVAAISIVHIGGGYWAIVAGSVIANVATTAISYFLAPYRPTFTLSRFRYFLHFLSWLSVSQIFSAISWQLDRILLGYFVSKPDLGRYAMASDLAALPTQSVIGPAMQPLVVAFSSIGDDRNRLRSAYLKASYFVMMAAAPICIGMSLTSALIVDVLLGAKWKEASVYLQWIALSVVLHAFYQPLHSLAVATNRTDMIFRLMLVEVLSRAALLPLGLYFYSIEGVIAARFAVSVIMFVATILAAGYLLGMRVISEIANLWKVAAASGAMAVTVMALLHGLTMAQLSAFIQLPIVATAGATAYFGALLVLGVRPKEYFSRVG
jgi:PST family polysaccharide transporter